MKTIHVLLSILSLSFFLATTTHAQGREGDVIYQDGGLAITGYRLELKKGSRWYHSEVMEPGYVHRIKLRFSNQYRATSCSGSFPRQQFKIQNIKLTAINGQFSWKSPGEKSEIQLTLADQRPIEPGKYQWYTIGEFTWNGPGVHANKPEAALQITTSHEMVARQRRTPFNNIYPTRKR